MLRNGCFGSAIAAQGTSPTCSACPERVECFAAVTDNTPATIERVAVRMRVRGEDTAEQEAAQSRAQRFLARTLLPPRKVALRSLDRVHGLRIKFQEVGADLSAIRNRTNPLNAARDGPFYHMADLVVQGVPFTPKDMAEHLYEAGCPLKKSSAMSEISRFVGLLVEDGILVRKDRHILCLA